MKRAPCFPVVLLAAVLVRVSVVSSFAQTEAPQPGAFQPRIVPPAVNDHTNWSRAPFPAARQIDDVKGPDGKEIDDLLSPNPVATSLQPPAPPPRVAIFQHGATSTPSVASEPALTPTGRPTTALSGSLGVATVVPALRGATMASRDQIFADVESRLRNSETAMRSLPATTSQMSAEARHQFDTVSDNVQAKARVLRKSIDAARRAYDPEWETARAQLANDYEAYFAALAQVDALTGLAPAAR